MFFNKRLRTAVWVTSIIVGILVILSPIIAGSYVPTQPYLIPLSQQTNNIITFGLLIAILFPAVVEYINHRWVSQIERSIPRLLRDIAEAVNSGVTLPKAVEEATDKGYGPLSKELTRVMASFALGNSWEDSVMSLTKRVSSPSLARFATILVEANQSGGKISEVLDMSVGLFSNIEQYKQEQRNNMKPYLYTVYAAIAIFLVIAVIVLNQFLIPLAASSKTSGGLGSTVNVLDTNYYASILFWASNVEALFAGLIAGKIGDNCYPAGLRHSVVLLILSLVFFNIVGGLT
ncbi:MAG: type II secretion system F family protein [Candidatus Bathyarchaeota archaeon]|nr:type II secretion system F family protein [Candidatus Bathyarchaeota archaeon]